MEKKVYLHREGLAASHRAPWKRARAPVRSSDFHG
jgi:hypothetical protein